MATIVTRAGKGSALTFVELDNNFTNLNTDKIELTNLSGGTGVTYDNATGVISIGQPVATTSDVTFNSLSFDNTELGNPTNVGQFLWNANAQTLDLRLDNNVVLQVGQEEVVLVRNNSGATITNGSAVYYTGTVGVSGRITVGPMIADGSIPADKYLGIATEDLANGADGFITTFGKVRNINTTGYTEGDTLWVSAVTPGALTNVEPDYPNLGIPTAYAINSSANGQIFVQHNTGQFLKNAGDVNITTPLNNDFLRFNDATDTWDNVQIGTADLTNNAGFITSTLTQNLDVQTNAITTTDVSARINFNGVIKVNDIGLGAAAITADATKDLVLLANNGDLATSPFINISSNGSLDFNANGNAINIDYATWPGADGTNGQVLTTDGAGGLGWGTRLSNVVEDTTPQLGGELQGQGNTVSNVNLKDYKETNFALSYAATITPDVANGNVQTITLTGNVTFSAFANPEAGQSLTLIIKQDATGSRTLTSTMLFAGGEKTLSTAANAIDIMSVFYDGTTYYASLAKGFA